MLGLTFLNLVENRINDATKATTIGGKDIAKANTSNDGSHVFVNINTIINEIKFPITGKADERATF